ncbi:hypothetical protein PtA15_6A819 [Puccinia triticina]|uniref:REJ domain-containing protein n=1 Tax=Puccinia triticina TaxID=208348 RepID=A0ABY7CTZ3_9BASI|nr:uncharacterized protein PtA15_6A819 [Puccinia triticina]WAQ86187.1 hypothetical protein PtA15_6A819 [Puccinia triticina]WAR56073.1 hypothetical protein PtB15_6B818 [Puccinia triticina]
MSLTPPPPPPHRPSGLAPSGCKTPKLTAAPGARRLSTASSNLSPSGSSSAPSPNQLRQILADITKQVTNSPQPRPPPPASSARPSPIRSHHPAINGFMRPSLRTRANTPVRDENHSPLVPATPRTPFATNTTSSPSFRSPPSDENQPASSSTRTPAHPIAPLRYRTLSSLAGPSSSPSSNRTTSELNSYPPTTTSHSSNDLASQPALSTPRERRSLDQVDSPSACVDNKPSPSGSIAKRRRRNPTGLGRL